MRMTHRGRTDTAPLAAAARSILACPDEVQLVVDGVDDIMAGLDPAGRQSTDDAAPLGMVDVDGHPVFSCPPDSALALAAVERRGALLTLTSGVGAPGSRERDAQLTIAGRLEATGTEQCECCDDVRATVTLQPSYVMVARPSQGSDLQLRVPLGEFCSPAHQLNRGFLQRSAEHANRCHQDELRRAVATTSGTRVSEIVGVQLADLRPERVDVRWVDLSGAHSRELVFPRAATTSRELGELLRSELHAGLC
ncbi:hypothetical protein HNR19_001584 [Nocardioides thalensis]|uniref:DUF2470 domain-containing protein n=1 Tax=Nocardioides thalensis TaxID=1914755 RepID=A0A853C1L6_9ACTN|nr:hypothetical protein [Nocardioides thalensis]NYJ00886.1 hypothetical protein [Nocardioides thalensis]